MLDEVVVEAIEKIHKFLTKVNLKAEVEVGYGFVFDAFNAEIHRLNIEEAVVGFEVFDKVLQTIESDGSTEAKLHHFDLIFGISRRLLKTKASIVKHLVFVHEFL